MALSAGATLGRPAGSVSEERRDVVGEDRIELGFLGPLCVTRDGATLDLGPRLQRTLLAVLLVDAGHVVSVDRLVDLLWGDDPPAAATASLQAYVSQLRRILEPDRPARAPARVLVTQDPGYALHVDTDQVDATRFEALASAAHETLAVGGSLDALRQLEEALALWRGEPLLDFAGEAWVTPVVARYAEIHDLALEDRVEAWLALGRHEHAVAELEGMVEAQPLRERRWAQLVIAYYRSGRQADALRAYQRCRAILAEELGIEPGSELQRLERAVLAQEPSLERTRAPETVPATLRDRHVEAVPSAPRGVATLAREVQLARLRDRVARAREGSGGVVVLVGEPGIGKTTLAEAVAELARAAGVTVAWSRCVDAASAPAYWPWTQLFRELPAGEATAAARRRLDGGLEPAREGGAAVFKTYELVLHALVDASRDATILAVVDDLHAADDSSLELLQHLAGDLHRLRVLVVVTLRDTEPSSALDRTLGELLRHRGVERLAVPSLEPEEVARLTEQSIGHVPEPELVDALCERTGGNAFYLVELLRILAGAIRRRDPGADDVVALDVPTGVRDVLARRLGALSDDTRALLTLAAVAGRDLDLDLLERAARVDSEHLMLGLEPALAAGLLSTSDGGWAYRFRHPLIHESIYAGLGRIERARLHARVGSALEESAASTTPSGRAQLAHHFLAAGRLGDPVKAIAYARDAARDAASQGAWGDATRHLEQALSAVSAGMPEDRALRCDVLVELARVSRSRGAIAAAHAALEEAIELADGIGDEDRVLAAAVAFGAVALWGSREWGETDPRLVAILERQLRRVGEEATASRVRILSTLAQELDFEADADRAWRYANEAVELARRSGGPQELGIAVSGYLLAGLVTDHLQERVAIIEELLADPELVSMPDVEALLRGTLLTERLRYGDLAVFDTEFAPVWDLATDVLHSPELQAQLCFLEACRDMLVGDATGAREAGERGFRRMTQVSAAWAEPSRFVMESSLMLISGTLAEHADEFAARVEAPDHRSIPHLAAPAAALAYAQRGDRRRAVELAERYFAPPPKAWTWIQPVAYWAQVAAAVGVPEPEWLYERLLPHAGELAIVGVGADCGGAVDSLLGALALQVGRAVDALAHARAGLALERHAGARAWIPRTSELVERARG